MLTTETLTVILLALLALAAAGGFLSRVENTFACATIQAVALVASMPCEWVPTLTFKLLGGLIDNA